MKLRILSAAYEISLGYEFCPDGKEAKNAYKYTFSQFSPAEIIEGVKFCHGLKRTQIAVLIIEEIASLKDAQELLKTYNRWRRGEDVTYIDPSDIGKAIDKLTL